MASVAVVLQGGELLHDYAFRVTRERDEARAERDAAVEHAHDMEADMAETRLRADLEFTRLRALLREARAMVADWAGYASPYFQEKHDLAGDLAKLDAALEGRDAVD